MSHQSRMAGVVFIGVLHLMSGVAGIATGGSAAQAGWVLAVVGVVLVGLAWRDVSGAHRAT